MAVRNVSAKWNGSLKEGNGSMSITDYTGPFTFASRFEDGAGTNPEELVGAAHAGCYSMFLTAKLGGAEFNPSNVETTATVNLGKDDKGPVITSIDLVCKASVEGISNEKFQEIALVAKEGCPISRLFAGTTINLTAELV